MSNGKYLYSLIEAREDKRYDFQGVEGESPVYTIVYKDIGALASDIDKDTIKVTVEGCLSHERVLKEAMKESTVLPFEFGTISPDKESVIDMLRNNYSRIKRSITQLRDKTEMNVRVVWSDMKKIFEEIVGENRDIALYKKEIQKKEPDKTYEDRIKIGQLVAQALYVKKEKEMYSIVTHLKRESLGYAPQRITGDNMILNAAFLVRKTGLERFESALHRLDNKLNGRVDFDYMGPLPPYNFTNLKIKIKR